VKKKPEFKTLKKISTEAHQDRSGTSFIRWVKGRGAYWREVGKKRLKKAKKLKKGEHRLKIGEEYF